MVKDYLVPALDKLGIKEKSDVLREVSTLFQNQMAGQMVGLLATQQARINKDLGLLSGAPGLEAADKAMREDPELAWQALKNSIESVVASFGKMTNAGEHFASSATSVAEALVERV